MPFLYTLPNVFLFFVEKWLFLSFFNKRSKTVKMEYCTNISLILHKNGLFLLQLATIFGVFVVILHKNAMFSSTCIMYIGLAERHTKTFLKGVIKYDTHEQKSNQRSICAVHENKRNALIPSIRTLQ